MPHRDGRTGSNLLRTIPQVANKQQNKRLGVGFTFVDGRLEGVPRQPGGKGAGELDVHVVHHHRGTEELQICTFSLQS